MIVLIQHKTSKMPLVFVEKLEEYHIMKVRKASCQGHTTMRDLILKLYLIGTLTRKEEEVCRYR